MHDVRKFKRADWARVGHFVHCEFAIFQDKPVFFELRFLATQCHQGRLLSLVMQPACARSAHRKDIVSLPGVKGTRFRNKCRTACRSSSVEPLRAHSKQMPKEKHLSVSKALRVLVPSAAKGLTDNTWCDVQSRADSTCVAVAVAAYVCVCVCLRKGWVQQTPQPSPTRGPMGPIHVLTRLGRWCRRPYLYDFIYNKRHDHMDQMSSTQPAATMLHTTASCNKPVGQLRI